MKQLLSFGHLHVLSSDSVEIILDDNVTLSLESLLELEEVVNPLVNKPYGLLLNMVNTINVNQDVLNKLCALSDIGCVAFIKYFSQPMNLLEFSMKKSKCFNGLKMGRTKGLQWLDQRLTKVVNKDSELSNLEG